jgi:uncharacterized phiE125 gp8 family phage protein
MFAGVDIYGGAVAGYSSINLTDASPPQSFVEPLTLADVKSYLKLPARSPADPGEDAGLSSLISAARGQAEILQGRDLVRKQWDKFLDYWPPQTPANGNFIQLRAPLVTVDLVQLKDSTGALAILAENTDYVVDTAKQPGVLAPPYNSIWRSFTPWPSSAILIRFKSGFAANSPWWTADGELVRKGMRELISDWFNNRLPFAQGLDPTQEYRFGVTAALSQGGIRLVG